MSFILYILLVFYACSSSSIESKNHIVRAEEVNIENNYSFECCLDSIIKQVDINTIVKSQPVDVKIKKNELFVSNSDKVVLRNNEIEVWLQELAIVDSIKAFALTHGSNNYYLFSSPIKQATGLAVNFTTWLIVDAKRNVTFEIWSLSNNSEAFYFDKVRDELQYISFSFSDNFVHQKDYDNISYKLELYSIKDGIESLIDVHQSQCNCN